ncbi:MAG: hypothetical protein ACRDLL_17615, partial [Solirubrobacterales bacterium]
DLKRRVLDGDADKQTPRVDARLSREPHKTPAPSRACCGGDDQRRSGKRSGQLAEAPSDIVARRHHKAPLEERRAGLNGRAL